MRRKPVKQPDAMDAYFNTLEEYTKASHQEIVEKSKDQSYKMSVKTALIGCGIGLLWAFKNGSGAVGYFGYALVGAFVGSALGGLGAIITGENEKV